MPPSRAESVATVGAARTRTRACYVRHRYSVSRPPLSLFGIKPPTFTMVPHAPTLHVIADTLTFPYRPSDRSPSLFSLLPPLFVAAVARAPVVGPATTSCVYPTLSSLICICARICKRVTLIQPRTTVTDRRLFCRLLVSSLHFHGK